MLEQVVVFLSLQLARAESAADLLSDTPQSVQERVLVPQGDTAKSAFAPRVQAYDLSDPMLAHFYQQWSMQSTLPFEVNQWAELLLTREFEKAEHLWGAIQSHLPEKFIPAATTAHLYSLWNLSVPQTFVDQWIAAQSRPAIKNSPSEHALELKIRENINEWVTKHGITLSATQRSSVNGQPDREPWLTLKVLANLKNASVAASLLGKIPATHKLKIPLAQSVTLGLIRKNDLKAAARVLKVHLEPSLLTSNDGRQVAKYYLQIARLLYQAGKINLAEQFYLKVPKGAAEFISAQQELGWVWLRQGKRENVQGLVKSLEQPVFENDFQPERLVIAGISNLKLCHYAEVQKNISEFIEESRRWNEVIKKSLASSDPSLDKTRDFYAAWVDTALQRRQTELTRLSSLLDASIASALPAVGVQAHWENAKKQIQVSLGELTKLRAQEAHRQWQNRELMLAEAARKMKFVRVELLSQVAQFAGYDALKLATSDPSSISDSGNLSFRFEGVVWPDELFTLRGVAEMRCLKGGKL